MEKIFKTDRLILRPWTLDDAEDALAIYGDPEVMGWLKAAPCENIEEQRQRLATMLERNAPYEGKYGAWALEEQASGHVVGNGLFKPLPNDERVEVGWHLGRTAWGKGYATEAGRRLVQYGFSECHLDQIYAIVLPENSRSIRVTERLAMRLIGPTDEFHDLTLNLYVLDQP
jgi:ribosomal-protein-alanine N-acetyltransferase